MTVPDVAGRWARAVNRVVTRWGWLLLALSVGAWMAGWQLGWAEAMWFAAGSATMCVGAGLFLLGRTEIGATLDLERRRVTVGDTATGRIEITNPTSRRQASVRMEVTVGRSVHGFTIPALDSGALHDELFVLPTSRRQVLDVGPVSSVRGDPLGLAERKVEWAESVVLYVHPRITQLESLGAGFLRDLEGLPTPDLVDTGVAFHALREYQPGDDRRFVHWRTTARVGTLMIRQFIDTRRSHLAIVLDTRPDAYATPDEFELAVSLAASLGARTLRDEQELSVALGDRMWAPHSGQQLLDVMAGIEMASDHRELHEHTVAMRRSVAGVSTLVLVTGSQRDLLDAQRAISRFGADVRSVILRAHLDGAAGLKTLGNVTVLNTASLDQLGLLLFAAGQQ